MCIQAAHLLLQHSTMQFVACNPYTIFPTFLTFLHLPGCSQSTVSSRTALEGEDHEVHWKELQGLKSQSEAQCSHHPWGDILQ